MLFMPTLRASLQSEVSGIAGLTAANSSSLRLAGSAAIGRFSLRALMPACAGPRRRVAYGMEIVSPMSGILVTPASASTLRKIKEEPALPGIRRMMSVSRTKGAISLARSGWKLPTIVTRKTLPCCIASSKLSVGCSIGAKP